MSRWYFEYTYNMKSNFDYFLLKHVHKIDHHFPTNILHNFTNLQQCNMTSFVQNTPEATIMESHFIENLFYSKKLFIYWNFVHCERIGKCDSMMVASNVAGGRVTRFPFGPLNVFAYISYWAARVNSQNKPHFEGDYRNWWLTRALLGASQLAASRSNMITYLYKIGRWYN